MYFFVYLFEKNVGRQRRRGKEERKEEGGERDRDGQRQKNVINDRSNQPG